MGLTGVRHELEYIVVQDMAQLGHPIIWVCQALSISRSAYYHWLHRTPSARERENRHILDEMRLLYQAYRGIYGYRRLADEYNAIHHTNYNEKRFHRLAKIGNLRAIIRTKQPAPHAAPLMQLPANILARDFVAQAPNEKWLTDVTELEYASGQKLYLSAILDLKANDIVAFNISPSNNNNLVFTTFDRAIEKYPDAHPLVHSDRGFQYTNLKFKIKLRKQGMLQSMSRAGMCVDNAPMEAFWVPSKAKCITSTSSTTTTPSPRPFATTSIFTTHAADSAASTNFRPSLIAPSKPCSAKAENPSTSRPIKERNRDIHHPTRDWSHPLQSFPLYRKKTSFFRGAFS